MLLCIILTSLRLRAVQSLLKSFTHDNLARKNAAQKGLKPPHVAFVQASLTEPLPIESDSVDCILSNCVINLLSFESKASLLKEVHRILKPGGRIVLDDIVAKKELPEDIKNDIASYVGCISGAVLLEQYKAILHDAGFSDVLCVDNKSDLGVYYGPSEHGGATDKTPNCCPPAPPGSRVERPEYDVNEWASSYQIFALKQGSLVSTPPSVLLRWWDAYPTVKSSPSSVTADEVAALIRGQRSAHDFAVIDGGHVRGSYNYHAQTFFDDLPGFYEKFKDTKQVIFYCQSSNGRGPRCAGWYQDYLNTKESSDHTSAGYVLKGGIKNWLSKFEGEEDLVDRD
ncbi:hypothetical protein CVT25_006993 [Psilocybe cyanescens]|uniref:Rhodanese domain-containing protein n=1 Tax=Psilocybe cyanescens TaxID=93625 RepID=A0A409WYB2_PSICY|nr:hypothetical protein CVT25_006993 [Psilocybe cyanescens]